MSEARPAAVIVLAAGEGTRMRSATPKALHQVCGQSMLGHCLAAAGELAPERLIVVVGHGADRVAAHARQQAPDAAPDQIHRQMPVSPESDPPADAGAARSDPPADAGAARSDPPADAGVARSDPPASAGGGALTAAARSSFTGVPRSSAVRPGHGV